MFHHQLDSDKFTKDVRRKEGFVNQAARDRVSQVYEVVGRTKRDYLNRSKGLVDW